jgi:hypothetical protein
MDIVPNAGYHEIEQTFINFTDILVIHFKISDIKFGFHFFKNAFADLRKQDYKK